MKNSQRDEETQVVRGSFPSAEAGDENPKLPLPLSINLPSPLNLKPRPRNPFLLWAPPSPTSPSTEPRGLSPPPSNGSLKSRKEENLGRTTLYTYGPSRTVVGEGILVILPPPESARSISRQGGGSGSLAGPDPGSGTVMMSVQGRGFPGCSSHLNGTEAWVSSGGGWWWWSGECVAAEDRGRNGNLSFGKVYARKMWAGRWEDISLLLAHENELSHNIHTSPFSSAGTWLNQVVNTGGGLHRAVGGSSGRRCSTSRLTSGSPWACPSGSRRRPQPYRRRK
ncbi:acyl activating enzyme 1 [Striga asiatica]|uniref:Acyl activating enzyme 1 n=1 Tax=Striga asiatica TaxID=4170 RepID=A0A5A7PYW8_STRAF|nr:acyl activating enzyme 1 [Striga asiatica]